MDVALMSSLLTFRCACVCVCVHKGFMLHIILRLCVSTGRAITMVTPSTEHLLKGSLAPSVFYLLWGHSASFTHSSRLGDRENGPNGGFPDIWSVMLFISRQFGTSEKSKPCPLPWWDISTNWDICLIFWRKKTLLLLLLEDGLLMLLSADWGLASSEWFSFFMLLGFNCEAKLEF